MRRLALLLAAFAGSGCFWISLYLMLPPDMARETDPMKAVGYLALTLFLWHASEQERK